jgi:1-pyrroline-5-carboxylate dehydrogenase
METKFRITYATMSADNEELQSAYDQAVETVRDWLGQKHPFYVNGEAREGEGYDEERSPNDSRILIGHFARAGKQDVEDAVVAARAAAPAWSSTPWQERVKILRRACDIIDDRAMDLSALTGYEVGKSRLEAMGDVSEAPELIRYYCKTMEENEGFSFPMGQLNPNEHTRSVLKPYGVWAVISPFNFPASLAIGPAGAALVAGNTVILKPSHQGYLTALKLYECFVDAGLPAGVLNVITGPGGVAGAALVEHPGVDGITFTGSYDVGMHIYREFPKRYPQPAICEMGGKNPAIVSRKADLDKAAEGVMRSAFGYSGQKCSACSRVYVEREVYDAFVQKLVDASSKLNVGNPLERRVYTGPVINAASVDTFEKAVEDVEAGGGRVLLGGRRLTEDGLDRGNFVAPTVVEAPMDHYVWERELFVPFVAVGPVDSLDEALERSNAVGYGLTAGFFSEDPAETERFLDRIEAGVVYVNRRAGATTGAWPGVQPFGGWKGSGSTGKAGGGLHYVQLFMREQSQTVIEG